MKIKRIILKHRRKLIAGWVLAILALMLSLPSGTHAQSQDLYCYITANFMAQTQATNAVTAIYLDYRMFDTLFETLLLLVSVIGIIYFSRHKGDL